ncbi:MAG TPA: hypothetical protein VG101_14970 [Puia sp.]|jgi:hypothetical protein|nr:hypothetical protein [Puia sp.]
MKYLTFLLLASGFLFSACSAGADKSSDASAKTAAAPLKDTLTYAYRALYSSDITVPGDPVIAQRVLTVWKLFETAQIQTMKPYFADSVHYDDAHGMHFYGPTDMLLAYAKSDIDALDSMRFDIIMWQSAHINDRNEDMVNIWSRERRYGKNHGKADTVLMQENWKVKNGKVIAFDQYIAKK